MFTPSRRHLLVLAGAAVLSGAAFAQASYPSKPVELVVPYAAGGGTDVLGRAFALAATKHLPQPLIVINKPGASGAIGWSDVINGKEPGYKIALLATDLVTIPHLGMTKITYQDFVPIARLNYDASAITVRTEAPWKTVEEFLEAAKKGTLSIGNAGTGNLWHLAAAALESKTGTRFSHVPFQGAAPAVLGLLGGHIDAVTVSAAEVTNHIAAGKLRILAVMSDKRIKGYDNVPTLKERGIDLQIGTWRALAVPKDTPAATLATLRKMAEETAKEPSFKEALEKQNMGYAYADGDAFGAEMARDNAFYRDLIQNLGLKTQ